MMAKATKVQLGKSVIRSGEGKVNIGKTVHGFLGLAGEPVTYADLLEMFERVDVEVPGDDSNAKTHPVRRMRGSAYRLQRKGLAKIDKKKGENPLVSLTAAGKKALPEAS
jgi:hypothetical protein